MSLRIAVSSESDWFDRLRGAWQDLLVNSENATIFQSMEWQQSWWISFGRRLRPHVVGVYEGKDLIGVYPLSVTKGLWRVARPMGKGISTFLHPMALKGLESKVSAELADYLKHTKDLDYMSLSMIRDKESILGQLGEEGKFRQLPSHAIRLSGTWDEFLADLPKDIRYNLRRYENRDVARGRARICELPSDEVQTGMNTLFRLSNMRWKGRAANVAFEDARTRDHYLRWGNWASGTGRVRLTIMEVSGEPVAALVAAEFNRATYFLMQGFHPDFKGFAPGTVLIGELVRHAFEAQHQFLEFLGGDETFKRRWKPTTTHQLHGWKHHSSTLRGVTAGKAYSTAHAAMAVAGKIRARRPSHQSVDETPCP